MMEMVLLADNMGYSNVADSMEQRLVTNVPRQEPGIPVPLVAVVPEGGPV